MKKWLPAVTVALAFSAGNASAQKDLSAEVLNLVKGVNAERAKAPKLKQAAKALVKRNERLNKEYKLYDNQIRQRLAPIKRALTRDATRYRADVRRHNQGVARTGAGCRGRLPKPQYDRCVAQKRYWDGRKRVLDLRRARLNRRTQSYRRQAGNYLRRMGQISREIKSNFQRWSRINKAYKVTISRLAWYANRLNRACSAAMRRTDRNAREAIRHCHSVRWDGARVNLPELRR